MLDIKPNDLAAYVLLTTRFCEVTNVTIPILNDDSEYVVDLSDLMNMRGITGADQRQMHLFTLEGARTALQDSVQIAENLLETQVQHFTALLASMRSEEQTSELQSI